MNTALFRVLPAVKCISLTTMSGQSADHDPDHIGAVYGHMIALARSARLCGAECGQLLISAQFHDIGRVYERSDPARRHHALISAERAEAILLNLGLDRFLIDPIVVAIREHSQAEPASTLIGRYLQDADKLDGFGWRAVIRIASHPNVNLDPQEVLEVLRQGYLPGGGTAPWKRLIIDLRHHTLWYDMLNTKRAREIGFQSYHELLGYCTRLDRIVWG